MWQGVIDGLKTDYHLLVPSLEGHEDERRTVFTTVEHNARSLSYWLCQNGYEEIYAVIDAGIIPVGFNRIQEFFEVSSNLFMLFAAHSLHLMKLLGLYSQYSQKQMEQFNKMIKTITWETAKNVFYGVDTYILPDDLSDITTNITYWYGSLEEKERKAAGERVKQLFPNVTIHSFDGYNHAQMCLAKPEVYVENVVRFIVNNKN